MELYKFYRVQCLSGADGRGAAGGRGGPGVPAAPGAGGGPGAAVGRGVSGGRGAAPPIVLSRNGRRFNVRGDTTVRP